MSLNDHLFVRLLGVALVLHETVYAADLGNAFFVRTFAPVFGVKLPASLKLAANVALIMTAMSLVVWPQSTIPRLALLPALTTCCVAASGRLSNHLVIAWFFALCVFADVATGKGVLAAATAPILAIVYGASAFAKLNADFFCDDISCGAHLARTVLAVWGVERMGPRSLMVIAVWAIVIAEASLAIGIIVAPQRIAVAAIALHVLFGLLCHVHFSAVMTAGVVYVAGLNVPTNGGLLCLATAVGAWLGLRFGNWRPYQHARLAAANQICYGIMAAVVLEAALPTALWPSAFIRPNLFGNALALLILSVFMLNCVTPYVGLKQAYCFAMFSNLRPDRWTHRVIARRLFRPLTRYYRVAIMSGLPTIDSLDQDVTARRAASDLLMFEHRKYSLAFLVGAQRLFPALRLTLCAENSVRPLCDVVATAPWWAYWCLDPLVLPADEHARVCE